MSWGVWMVSGGVWMAFGAVWMVYYGVWGCINIESIGKILYKFIILRYFLFFLCPLKRKIVFFWGCLDVVWRCLDGVYRCLGVYQYQMQWLKLILVQILPFLPMPSEA